MELAPDLSLRCASVEVNDGLLCVRRDFRPLSEIMDSFERTCTVTNPGCLRKVKLDAAADALLLGERRDTRPMDIILDELLDGGVSADMSLPSSPWGEKVGISVFDDEEILGRYDPKLNAYVFGREGRMWDDEDDLFDFEDDDGIDEDFAANWAAEWDMDHGESDEVDAFLDELGPQLPAGPSVYSPTRVELPRLAKLIQPFCFVYEHEGEALDACPICLEHLGVGERAWRLPCTHAVHEVCMLRFLRSRCATGRCPICRCELRKLGVATLLAEPLHLAESTGGA